jgi:hypothetical protein
VEGEVQDRRPSGTKSDMLCERCHSREATVHLTLVNWHPADLSEHALCDTCHASAQKERVKGYNFQQIAPCPENVREISAEKFLELSSKAAINGADKPAFRHVQQQLSTFPETRQRLAFELLELARQALEEHGKGADSAALNAALLHDAIEPQRRHEYVGCLKKITIQLFDIAGEVLEIPRECYRYLRPIDASLMTLAKLDRAAFEGTIEALKSRAGNRDSDPRWQIIACAERIVSGSGGTNR